MNNQESKKQKKMTACNGGNDIVASNDPISETRNKRRKNISKQLGN